MKVIRLTEKQTYQAPVKEVAIAEHGWAWCQRHHLSNGLAVVGGIPIFGSILGWILLPIYKESGQVWLIALWLAGMAVFTFFLQRVLLQRLLLDGLLSVFHAVATACVQRVTVSKESLRKDSGVEGANVANALNKLILFAKAETGAAPLQAYREAFLAGAQPSYICDLGSGRFLDCNHAFAAFIGIEREALLLQRLGDITVGATTTTDFGETGQNQSAAAEDAPAVEMRFRHSSGKPREAITFIRSVPDYNNPRKVVHCAIVVPQETVLSEKV